DLLAACGLRARPSPYPPREQLPIVAPQIDRNEPRRHGKHHEVQPRLPVVERPRGHKQREAQRHKKGREAEHGPPQPPAPPSLPPHQRTEGSASPSRAARYWRVPRLEREPAEARALQSTAHPTP